MGADNERQNGHGKNCIGIDIHVPKRSALLFLSLALKNFVVTYVSALKVTYNASALIKFCSAFK
jgi:hypothetical protein